MASAQIFPQQASSMALQLCHFNETVVVASLASYPASNLSTLIFATEQVENATTN
jgi:hypothetical protein